MTPANKSRSASRTKRVFLAGMVPFISRPTLFFDIRSAPFNGIYMGVLTLLPWVVRHTLGGSDWEVAVLTAAPIVCHLLDVYWAHLCQNRPKMPWVLYPGMIARLMMMTVGFAVNSTMLVLIASVSYLVQSIPTTAINAIWRNNYPGTHRYRVMGVVLSVMYLVMAATSYGSGQVLRRFDDTFWFRIVIPAGCVFGVLGVYVFSRIKVRGERPRRRADTRRRRRFSLFGNMGLLWRDRRFGKYMLVQFTSGFSNLMTVPVLVALLKYQGVHWEKAALVLGVAPNVLMALTIPLWGRVLQRFNPMQARAFFGVVWAAGYVIIAFSGDNVNWVILARAVTGVASGATMLLWFLQQMYFARRTDVPKYMGVHCTLTGIRGAVAPFVGVWLMGLFDTPHPVFLIATVGTLAAGAFALHLARHERRTSNHTGHVDGAGLKE